MNVLIRLSARKCISFRDSLKEGYEDGQMQAPFVILVC